MWLQVQKMSACNSRSLWVALNGYNISSRSFTTFKHRTGKLCLGCQILPQNRLLVPNSLTALQNDGSGRLCNLYYAGFG